jgi:hypothetical protein
VALGEEFEALDCGVACVDAALDEEVTEPSDAFVCVDAALFDALDVPPASNFSSAASGNFTVTSVRFTYTRPSP